MKAQRVDMFVCPSATPADTSGLQALADAGRIKPDTLVALVGKTEGTGAHDDWGRIWADAALREWTATGPEEPANPSGPCAHSPPFSARRGLRGSSPKMVSSTDGAARHSTESIGRMN